MAISFEVPSCFANPRRIRDKEEAAGKLAAFFNLPEAEIARKLNKDKAFVWIKRHLTKEEIERFDELDVKEVGLIKESKRFYPDEVLAAHVLGFVGIDNQGLEGLELYYDDYLKGIAGMSIMWRDAKGRYLEAKEYTISEAVDGNDMVLTIDKYIQHIAERELDKVYERSRAKGAVIVVMEPSTGEILALASRPTFDPNNISEYTLNDFRNRAICDMFEPGSVFKIVTATAALEEGTVTPEDKIFCENGQYRVGSHTLHDHRPHGELTFEEVIEHSSNIGTVKVAQRLGAQGLYEYVRGFGFGSLTGIDFPSEAAGIIRKPEQWSGTSISAVPIGHEVTVTAVQMLSALCALANDGVLVRPHLVKRIVSPSKDTLRIFDVEQSSVVCSQETAETMRSILTTVVESGTGRRAKIEGVKVAGKTGTAQKIEADGSYSHSKYMATFAGFLPADEPKLAIIVVVDEPRGVYYGGSVSAPAFQAVARDIINYVESYNLN